MIASKIILPELKENYKEMKNLIENQNFKVKDAEYYMERYYNIIRSMEDLIKSRDNWEMKYKKLKEKQSEVPKETKAISDGS